MRKSADLHASWSNTRRDGVESMRPRSRPREVDRESKKPDSLVHRRDGAERGTPAPFDLMHFKAAAGQGEIKVPVVCVGKRLLRLSAKERGLQGWA